MRRFAVPAGMATLVAGSLLSISAGGPVGAEPFTGAGTRRAVIVVLRDQHTVLTPGTHRVSSPDAAHPDQAEVVRRARRESGTRIHQLTTINAVAMSLTPAAMNHLRADPQVAAVVPDLPIRTSVASREVTAHATGAVGAAGTDLAESACPKNPSDVQLEPEALRSLRVTGEAGREGAADVTTGAGVTVGYIADGIDINNPDFIRDGKSIFADYRDFSGSGPASSGAGFESFGDASAIAAQGNKVYDVADFVNPAHALAQPCLIRIRGVAPGVKLVGLKDSDGESTPTSTFVQALDYAVNVDHVDVLNESVGSNPYPDQQNDPITLANRAALAAGVTVVASTGDDGSTNTINSPASDPDIIAVGASTDLRIYEQTTEATNLPGITGVASGNISSLSSAGFTEAGRLLDVVAPGDSDWSVCTPDPVRYSACVDDASRPSPIHEFGGTSQAAPFTAGVAALVIAAYRQAHPGAPRPTPALVKHLITSTARDLGYPAQLQGAGQVDALAAVQAAQAVPAEAVSAQAVPAEAVSAQAQPVAYPARAITVVSAARNGDISGSLLTARSQLDLSGQPGSMVSGRALVTNLSSVARTVTARARQLSQEQDLATGHLRFDTGELPKFTFAYGDRRAYTYVDVDVPAGQDRVSASYAFTGGSTRIQADLIDPHGTLQAFSSTQGPSNYGHLDAAHPLSGRWRLYLFSILPLTTRVEYRVSAAHFIPSGAVFPQRQVVGPHQNAWVTYSAHLPISPGDSAAAVTVTSSSGLTMRIPVSLRTRALLTPAGLRFRGAISGGNGRGGGPAEVDTFYLDVPAGLPNLSAAIKFDSTRSYLGTYLGMLVSPGGQALSAHSNVEADAFDYSYNGVQLSVAAPQPGRWKLMLETANPVIGDLVDRPYSVTVTTTPDSTMAAPELPDSPDDVLPAGKTTTIQVAVTNRGRIPQTYFLDPRREQSTWYRLASQIPDNDLYAVPLRDQGFYASWLVPDHTDAVEFAASAPDAILLDAQYAVGDPELLGAPGTTSYVSATARQVAPGQWLSQAQLVGPFSAPEPDETARYQALAHTREFDTSMRSSTGDYWRLALIPNGTGEYSATTAASPTAAAFGPYRALTLAPGHSGTITVAIDPRIADRGTVVDGQLTLDSLDAFNGSADQISTLPYRYRVSSASAIQHESAG